METRIEKFQVTLGTPFRAKLRRGVATTVAQASERLMVASRPFQRLPHSLQSRCIIANQDSALCEQFAVRRNITKDRYHTAGSGL
jgi:hypothetical protein